MKHIIHLLSLLLIAGSCAPRISTVVLKQYSVPDIGANVEVYFIAQHVPAGAEPLGQVTVGDSGMTTSCDSTTMILYVKQEAQKIGGNAVLITKYRRPTFWGSSCHQFQGTILRMDDSRIIAHKTDSSSDDLIAPAVAEIINPSEHDIRPKFPKWVLALNGGWAFRTAKIYPDLSPSAKKALNELSNGWNFDGYVDYFFNDNYGLRFIYTQYNASSDYGFADAQGVFRDNFYDKILLAGPAFVMRYGTSDSKWFFNISLGIGYMAYISTFTANGYNSSISGETVGVYYAVNGEYRFAKNFGIGIDISSSTGTLSQAITSTGTPISFDDNKKEGLGNVKVQAGLRMYF